jgi:ABC-2 type transport system ATP-binding protein
MADVEALCRRVIVIHHGRLLFDGSLSELVGQFSAYKTIGVTLEDPSVDLAAYGEVTGREADRVLLRVPKAETSRITARLLADLPITDLTVEEPPIEDVITRVFAQERPEAGIPHGHGDPSDKTGAETECEPTPIST